MTEERLIELERRLKTALGQVAYNEARDIRIIVDELLEAIKAGSSEESPFSILRKLDEIKKDVLQHQQKITVYPNELDIVIVPKVVDGEYVLSLFHKADGRVAELVEESLALMLPNPIFTEGTRQININLGVRK